MMIKPHRPDIVGTARHIFSEELLLLLRGAIANINNKRHCQHGHHPSICLTEVLKFLMVRTPSARANAYTC